MRRAAFTLIELVVVLVIMGTLAAILYPVFYRTNCNERRFSCQTNLKQLSLSLQQYTQDYEAVLPRVAGVNAASGWPPYKQPYGWADALHPYHRRIDSYQCPSEKHTARIVNSRQYGFTDYWMNRGISGAALKAIKHPGHVVLFGDGGEEGQASDARYSFIRHPDSWQTSSTSPATRHVGGSNYAFVDGHAKWYRLNMNPEVAEMRVEQAVATK